MLSIVTMLLKGLTRVFALKYPISSRLEATYS
jgi:hypothetical protein